MSTVQFIENLADRLALIMRRPAIVASIVLLALACRLLMNSPADLDLFARVALGRLVVASGAVPMTDPFAFTPKLPHWIDHEWLSGVVFYLTTHSLGDIGIIWLKVLLSCGTALLTLTAARTHSPKTGGSVVWSTACLLHAAGAWLSTIRCQAFTYLFIPALYLAITSYQQRGSIVVLALTPLMALLWVNLHGGYALGFIILLIFIGCEHLRRRFDLRLLFIALAWGLAPAFTPYGFTTFLSVLTEALTMERGSITEWLPLLTTPQAFWIAILISIPLLLGAFIRRRDSSLLPLVLLTFSAYCALRHGRFLAFYMITAATFGGDYVAAFVHYLRARLGFRFQRIERATTLALLIVIPLCAFGLTASLLSPRGRALDYSSFPVRSLQWLRESGQSGRLLVDFNRGSFALWRLYPHFTVSLDGRYEAVYTQQTVMDVSRALSPEQPGSHEILSRLNPTHILVELSPSKVDPASDFGPEWHTIYRDESYAILSNVPVEQVATSAPGPLPSDMWDPLF